LCRYLQAVMRRILRLTRQLTTIVNIHSRCDSNPNANWSARPMRQPIMSHRHYSPLTYSLRLLNKLHLFILENDTFLSTTFINPSSNKRSKHKYCQRINHTADGNET
jgi:hypothetical protein